MNKVMAGKQRMSLMQMHEKRDKYLNESPLFWFCDAMLERNVTHITLCKYSIDENYEAYRRDRVLVAIPDAEKALEALVKECGDEEVGLCSTVMKNTETFHALFFDLDNLATEHAGAFAPYTLVRSSAKGVHAYSNIIHERYEHVIADILDDSVRPHVDMKWIKCGLRRGFNVLRLTALTERFEDNGRPIVVSVP